MIQAERHKREAFGKTSRKAVSVHHFGGVAKYRVDTPRMYSYTCCPLSRYTVSATLSNPARSGGATSSIFLRWPVVRSTRYTTAGTDVLSATMTVGRSGAQA